MTQAATDLTSIPSAPVHLDADAHVNYSRAQIVDINRAERAAQERDLVARLLLDDPSAWRFFTQEYSRVALASIRRVLTRFTRVTDEHDVDEIYARFCFELLANNRRKLRWFDPEKGSRLSTWVGLLANNATYDYLRRLKRHGVCDPLPEQDCIQADTASPLEQAELQERAIKTAELLAQLSDRDREFVELYFGRGMSPEDIAHRMNISIKTVYTKRHKISARLESLMAMQ